MGTINNRCLAIDWMKGVMITIIVLHHFFLIPGFRQSYLPVDFFFFIAGYYLMNHFTVKQCSALYYTMQRVKKFYPALIITLVLSCVVFHSRLDFSSFDSAIRTIGSFSLLLSLTNGLVTSVSVSVLDVSWFLSILIIAGYLIYALLVYDKNLALHILLPICLIIGYTLLFNHNPSIQQKGILYGLNLSLVRGFCDMSAGVIIYEVYRQYKKEFDERWILINILCFLSFFMFLAIMFSKQYNDIFIVVVLPILTLGTVQDRSLLNSFLHYLHGGLFSIIGRFSFEILIIHQLVMVSLYKLLEVAGITLSLYLFIPLDLIMVFISAYLLKKVASYLTTNEARLPDPRP